MRKIHKTRIYRQWNEGIREHLWWVENPGENPHYFKTIDDAWANVAYFWKQRSRRRAFSFLDGLI